MRGAFLSVAALVACLGLPPLASEEQLPALDEGPIEFGEVVYVEGASAKELHLRAKLWVVDAFRSVKDVVQLEDPDALTVSGRGNFEYVNVRTMTMAYSGRVWFRFEVMSKDGRYRYRIFEFTHESTGGAADVGPITDALEPPPTIRGTKNKKLTVWTEVQNVARVNGRLLAETLKARMQAPAKGSGDW